MYFSFSQVLGTDAQFENVFLIPRVLDTLRISLCISCIYASFTQVLGTDAEFVNVSYVLDLNGT